MAKAKNVAAPKTVKIVLTLTEFSLIEKLLSAPMHGEVLRMRNKFFNLIEPIHLELYNRLMTLREPLYKDIPKGSGTNEKEMEGIKKLEAEADEKFARLIIEEKTEIEVTKEVKSLFRNAYFMLLKSTKDLGKAEGKTYDEVMTKIEDLNIVNVKG